MMDERFFVAVVIVLMGLTVLPSTAVSQDVHATSDSMASGAAGLRTDYVRPDFELEMQIGLGRAEYAETGSITPILSDWEGSALLFGAGLTLKPSDAPLFRLRQSFWVADEDVESWREQGQLVQLNQMNVYGLEFVVDVGHAFVESRRGRLRGWAGLGFRQQEFERSEFDLIGRENPDIGVVDESISAGFVRLALDGTVAVSRAVSLEGDFSVGLVFFNEANNSLLGDVEGEGGTLVSGRIALAWQIDDLNKVSLGVHGEVQDLEGDTSLSGISLRDGNIVEQVIEWPDNELILSGLDLRWTYSF